MKLFERQADPMYEIFQSENKSRKRKRFVLVSIDSLISRKDKKKFVKKLFDNNGIRYEEFIQKLNLLRDWSSSYRKMEEEFTNRKLTMQESEVLAFTDMVFRRFYPD